MLASNLVNWSWQVFYLLSLAVTYWRSGVLLDQLPAIAFYLTLLVTFVKESGLMISHFRFTENINLLDFPIFLSGWHLMKIACQISMMTNM